MLLIDYSHFTRPNIPAENFNWQKYFEKKTFNKTCPQLSCFGPHIPLSYLWAERVKDMYVEFSVMSNQRFWFYKIEDTFVYYVKLSALGNSSYVVWVHIICPHFRGFSYLNKQKNFTNKTFLSPIRAQKRCISNFFLFFE